MERERTGSRGPKMCVMAARSAKEGCTGSAGSRHTGHTCSLRASSHALMQSSVQKEIG